jgi:hypothetical protein
LAMRKRVLGDDHPDTNTCQLNRDACACMLHGRHLESAR